ncbi:MAG: hypothetical protein HRT35_12580 [Algicola sp.]|nr:hypothetical protein [Algicola sp.]
MLLSFFYAIFGAFLPLLAISFMLAHWFVKMQPDTADNAQQTSTRVFKAQLADFNKAEKRRKKQKHYVSDLNPVQAKWLIFGGNFYGVVALYTYLLVELADLAKFFREFTSVSDFINRINLGMLIDQLIQALMNFITAITWPKYWIETIEGHNAEFIWLGMAYLGYLAGIKAALYYRVRQESPPDVE